MSLCVLHFTLEQLLYGYIRLNGRTVEDPSESLKCGFGCFIQSLVEGILIIYTITHGQT